MLFRIVAAQAGLSACLKASEPERKMRLVISETMVADVNINDARAAMSVWIARLSADLNFTVELDPRVFVSSEEVLRRIRTGQVDGAAMNMIEYREVADYLDNNGLIVARGGGTGADQFLLIAKRPGARQLSDLRGRRICLFKSPATYVAPAWLSTILDDAHLGPATSFFAAVTTETKVARVVLPVFFGQADACIVTKRGFETMCELNPQVSRDLTAIAASPLMVGCFYAFRRNYHDPARQKFTDPYKLLASPTGRQLATFFQFEELMVTDVSILAPSLKVLERADRMIGRKPGGADVSH